MEWSVTRYDLASAITRILLANAVPSPEDAVQVLAAPGNGTRLFAVIPTARAKLALEQVLMRITGHQHSPAGDVWILDEAQSQVLIRAVEAAHGVYGHLARDH